MALGEMAPKSWGIAHPERSATILALPFRGFTLAVRPVIAALNVPVRQSAVFSRLTTGRSGSCLEHQGAEHVSGAPVTRRATPRRCPGPGRCLARIRLRSPLAPVPPAPPR
ncbi:hypothetical protein ACQEVF_07110 [Nonomuraea polychroma]|uniref:hypothetical protein n=1 Tax=Nonomuraea polychroma TaxID=46176 RepID=UPI003D915300